MKSTRAAQFFEISDIQSRNGRKDACYENQEVGGSNDRYRAAGISPQPALAHLPATNSGVY
jgi:hypothetical protein